MTTTAEVLKDAQGKMLQAVKVMAEHFTGIRTGKASPALVENIQVPYYGTPTRLRDMATISAPEMRLLVITPFDPSALKDIEHSIQAANIGVTPICDGRVVRVPIPELSEERRKEMTKVAHRMAEEARVSVRNVRRDANEAVKALKKGGKISEDDEKLSLEKIQKETDAEIAKIDAALKAKEAEVMAV
ncbi:MAG: ribosome recycling factor [Kiritimatiellaeota bacterium]|nr:ribosome recycling factor [Kiritimatiellota bacterium]